MEDKFLAGTANHMGKMMFKEYGFGGSPAIIVVTLDFNHCCGCVLTVVARCTCGHCQPGDQGPVC